jgi:hypothetical protein
MLRTMIARLVAAELDYWLRRDLIGPQDILLDPPHLQMRAALDEKEAPDAQSWNATAQSREAPFGLMPTAYDAVYSKHRFAHSEWLPYPGFWWPAIERDEAFLALREKYHVRSLLVFCEDTRRFQEAGSATPPERFVPEGSRPWSPRFVELVADRGYYPQSQFAA